MERQALRGLRRREFKANKAKKQEEESAREKDEAIRMRTEAEYNIK